MSWVDANFWCGTAVRGSLVSVLISLAWSILSASGSPGKWNVVTVVDLVASVVVVFQSVVRLGAV